MSGILRETRVMDTHFLTSPSALLQKLPASPLLTLERLSLFTLGSCGMWGATVGLGLKLLVFFTRRLGPEDTCVPCPRLLRREWQQALRPCEDYSWRGAGLWCLLPSGAPYHRRVGTLGSLVSVSLASPRSSSRPRRILWCQALSVQEASSSCTL